MNYVDLSPSTTEKEQESAGSHKENESTNQYPLNASHSLQVQDLENKTVSRDSHARFSSAHEEKQRSSNAAFGATRKTDEENENEKKSSNSNETMKADKNKKEKAEENSNANNGSEEVSLSAGEAETDKKGSEVSEDTKNEEKESTDDNNKNEKENKKLGEDERTNKDKETENRRKVTTKSDEDESGKYIGSKRMKEKFNAANETVKINTIRQFDKLLSRFLNNSSPEKGKELLKLTWHDLRQRYSKDPESNEENTRKIGNGENEENSKMNMNESNDESGGTASKQKLKSPELSPKSEDFKSTVGRIKEKLALLKELVAYTKMKKQQKLKKHFDPYAGFKRGGIH